MSYVCCNMGGVPLVSEGIEIASGDMFSFVPDLSKWKVSLSLEG